MKRKTIFPFKMSITILIGLICTKEYIHGAESANPLTNLEFLAELADSMWQDCLKELPVSENGFIIIEKPDPEIGLGDWAMRRLEKKCLDNGIRILTSSDTLKPDWILRTDLFNFSLFYPACGRAGFFGRKWIDRYGILHADVQCLTHTGSILLHKTYKYETRDRLFADQLVYAEQNNDSLNFPDPPEFHDLISRAETWLMIGSMTAVLYLFYIIRS